MSGWSQYGTTDQACIAHARSVAVWLNQASLLHMSVAVGYHKQSLDAQVSRCKVQSDSHRLVAQNVQKKGRNGLNSVFHLAFTVEFAIFWPKSTYQVITIM